jgi:Rrf2 family nitric oxide-sensitive transcriptional repressor
MPEAPGRDRSLAAQIGIAESVRGNGGGIRLARSPEEIRLGEIVRASEGSAPIVECLSGDPRACRIASPCRLKRILVSAFDALYDSLDEHTLADLVEKPRALTHALIRA